MEKILVIIPAYEDDLLLDTIDSCLEKAEYPDRIVFSIGMQYKNYPAQLYYPYEWFTSRPPHPKKEQFKIINYNVDNRPGLTRIMHDLCRLHTDEDYVLMINAHTAFGKNWDTSVIEKYKDLKDISENKKVIISSTSSTPPGFINENMRSLVTAYFTSDKYLDFSYKVGPTEIKDKFLLSHLGTTIFFFVEKDYIYEDVFDSISDIGAIEPMLSFYSYIMGWDIYQHTEFNFAYHIGDNQWKHIIDENEQKKTVPNGDPRYWKQNGEKIWSNSKSNFYANDISPIIWRHLLYSDNKGLLRKHPNKISRKPVDFFKAVGLYDGYLDRTVNTPEAVAKAIEILYGDPRSVRDYN